MESSKNSGMTVGKRIREARKARNDMTRPVLAQLSGVPYPTLAGLENGDQHSSTALPALAAALQVHALWLSTGKGPRDLSEPFTPETAATPGLRPVSQSTRPDQHILHEALTLLAFSEEQAGAFPDRARTAELLRLYEWCAREGGRLSDESSDAFEASVWARKNRLQGVTRDARPEEPKIARPRRRAK